MQKINYQKLLDKITDRIGMECAEGNNRPSLFLHACCAPCSSYVLEYLVKYFKITIFYYNPNITPETEYIKRVKELKRFIREVGYENDVTFVEGTYDPQVFFDMAKGMEDLPERGLRCYHCYALRMEEAAKKAAEAAKKENESSLNTENSSDSGDTSKPNEDVNSKPQEKPSEKPNDNTDHNTEKPQKPSDNTELALFAAILECEAGSTDYDALLAVATVIMNRKESPKYPDTITGVIYQSGQFSPTWTGKLDKVLERGAKSLCYTVAQDALNGARHSAVKNCYSFRASYTGHDGIIIGDNVFF